MFKKKKKDTKNALKAWNGIKKKLIKILKKSMEKINCFPISIYNLSEQDYILFEKKLIKSIQRDQFSPANRVPSECKIIGNAS